MNFQHLYPTSGQRGSLFSFSLRLIFSFTFLHEIEKDFLEDVQSPTYRCCASVIFAKQCNAWRKTSICFSGSLSLLFQFLLILLLVFFLFKTKQNKNTFTYNNHQGWLGIKNQFSVTRKQQAIYAQCLALFKSKAFSLIFVILCVLIFTLKSWYQHLQIYDYIIHSYVPKHNLGIMGYNNYVQKQSIDYTCIRH